MENPTPFEAYCRLMDKFYELEKILKEGPSSREKSIALTYVQTARLWMDAENDAKKKNEK